MIPLSRSAVDYAFHICIEKDYYLSGIYVHSDTQTHVSDDIISLARLYQSEISRIKVSLYETVVEFNNGSVLIVLRGDYKAVGRRFHLIVCDEKIDPDIIACVIRHSECRYRKFEEK